GDGADAADDQMGAAGGGVVDQQAFERSDFDVGIGAHHFAEHLRSFFDAEQRILGLIAEYSDNEMLHQAAGPGDQVEVAVGDRIERTGVNRDGFFRRFGQIRPLLAPPILAFQSSTRSMARNSLMWGCSDFSRSATGPKKIAWPSKSTRALSATRRIKSRSC